MRCAGRLQGDVLVLDTGDKVVADGLFISGHNLVIDEASLTGESDPKKKSCEKPWLRSGTQVRALSIAALSILTPFALPRLAHPAGVPRVLPRMLQCANLVVPFGVCWSVALGA